MKTLRLKGEVLSGKSKAVRFIELPWVMEQIEAKLGFKPYPGTLNMGLLYTSPKLQMALATANSNGQEISPKEGFCLGKCLRAYLASGSECAIVTPEVAGYPKDIIEIIAPVNLRERFRFRDGDPIEIKIVI